MFSKKLWKSSILFFILLLISLYINAQTISPLFFGQNAWMPDSIGSVKYYGQLHKKWQDIKKSSAAVIRFGGIGADKNKPTNYQYIQMIDSIRNNGMEPIMQVSFNNNQYTAAQAADVVRYINVTKAKNIKYWIIANEPDHVYGYTSSSQVAPYLKSFSYAMKDVDPSILLIGPECAWYNTGIINGLTTPGGSDDVTGKDNKGRYIMDYISFHTYPFNGSQTRESVISNLTASGKFNDNLVALNARLNNCNSFHGRSGTNAVKIAVTEANIDYQNSSSDNLYGNGAMSFIGGQFWAEMMAVALKNKVEIFNFWSVIEGNTIALNIGYIDKFTGYLQPSYHHFKLMAENFKGAFCNGTDNQLDVKAFGSKDNSTVSVMILNQNLTTNYNYTLRMNNNTVSGSNPLKINIDASIDKEYTDLISSQSTTLLVFDLSGNLIKKCEYSLNKHASANLPPNCITTSVVTQPVLSVGITAQGPTAFCSGGKVVLTSNDIPGATFQWKKNGLNIAGENTLSYAASASGDYTLEASLSGTVAISNKITVTVESAIQSIINASGSLNICSGGSVLLSANNGSGYIYQWKKDVVDISGATGSSYTANSGGSYEVNIISGACASLSSAANVSVTNNLTATITASGSLNFCSGGSVLLSANTGSGYIYQWKKDGVNISGATGSSYTATSGGSYQVNIISGACSSLSSAAAVSVTSNLTASITASGSLNFCSGGSVLLSANTGSGYNYQWKKDGVNISGATSSSYTATSGGSYQVNIISGACSSLSSAANVSVTNNLTASITASGSLNICSGGSVLLNANTGSGYNYQWKKDGVNISGATSSSFTATSSGSYQVNIISGACSSLSSPANVLVTNTLTASITASGSLNICSGGSVLLSANTGSGYIYQWKKDGFAIFGATNSTYAASSGGSYQVKIISGTCVAWSAPVTIKVTTDFKATITPSGSTSFTAGKSVILKANTGIGYVYQWKKNGVNISGATGSSFTATTSGDYQVKIISGTCVAWSAPLKVTVYSARLVAFSSKLELDSDTTDLIDNIIENTKDIQDPIIKVFANPSKGFVNLNMEFPGYKGESVFTEIINSLGQPIFQKSFLLGNDKIAERFEFENHHSNGMYFMRIIYGKKSFTEKLLLNR